MNLGRPSCGPDEGRQFSCSRTLRLPSGRGDRCCHPSFRLIVVVYLPVGVPSSPSLSEVGEEEEETPNPSSASDR